ncbi:hypothetical protein ACP2YA_10860 [Staphylococcus epidermidis]|uniref:hypothetical protein n=1 Tax=Staphylococcus epidermidis TaxID=1282 RepID=UPI0011A61EE1|nr:MULTISPECIES: hypothetical protein [Terrabacteria group]MBT2888982.1 hypothetical protein [Streptomyces sp. McG2]MCG1317496.1 hypothetical protein [Staphylococcus epidermidis]MCG1469013.1 hypothetical protein [Staphylococcus epidermidis]MCG2539883.1 hypothetical protein [Staphylococcus epidermidis]MCG2571695.1 hypothetical protein [Staphylococcus epidermidis]
MTKTKEFINDYLLICKNIRNYKLREFEETLNIQEGLFDSNLKCPLAYTTIGEEENIEVQVTLDLENMRVVREVIFRFDEHKQCKKLQTDVFKNTKEVVDFTSHIHFDELVDVDEEYYEILMGKEEEKYQDDF